MAEEHEFNAPADQPEEARAEAEAFAAVVGPAALVGTWNACDAATRSLVRVVIAASGSAITVHAFGACTPTPCDWGSVPGLAYARTSAQARPLRSARTTNSVSRRRSSPASSTTARSSSRPSITSPTAAADPTTTRKATSARAERDSGERRLTVHSQSPAQAAIKDASGLPFREREPTQPLTRSGRKSCARRRVRRPCRPLFVLRDAHRGADAAESARASTYAERPTQGERIESDV
jgi:hypothetical protein